MADAEWRTLANTVAVGLGPWRLPTEPPTRAEQMLALACHAHLTDDMGAQVAALGQQMSELDWHLLMGQARAGYLGTLLYAQIAAVGLLPLMPQEVKATFDEMYRETLLQNLRLRTALENLLRQFAEAGIEVVPLKGVVLAERVYGNIAWRSIRDIDLLVHRADIPHIDALLRGDRYFSKETEGDAQTFWAIEGTETKHTRADAPIIELHWGLSKRPTYRHGLVAEAIWARTQTETWHGQTIRVLSRADELRYLAIHCTADHLYSQLNWLVDIAEIVHQLPGDWQWSSFVDETIASQLATPIALALAQCRAVLQLDIPDEPLLRLLRAAESHAERAAWKAAWARRLSGTWIITQVRAIPSPRERLRFATGALARAAAAMFHLRRSWFAHRSLPGHGA